MLGFFSFLALAPIAVSQSIPLKPHLFHPPVLQAAAGADLLFRLDVEDGVSEIVSANLLWRPPGGEFRTLEFSPVVGGLICTIPAQDVRPPQLEYAVLIRFFDGSEASFPLNEALMRPQVIAITTEPEKHIVGPEFVVLYPRAGEVLYESDVNIAVSIFDPDSLFDPATLEVQVDGKRIAPGQSSASYLFIQASGLAPGKHEVLLRSKSFAREANDDYAWSFRVGRGKEEMVAATFNWSFNGEALLENFGGETEGVLRGDLRLEGNFRSWEYSARLYKTSEEARDRQPQDRFLVSVRKRHLYLNLGDTNPIFSDLVLSGKRVRGTEFGANLGSTHLIGVFGEVSRRIEGSTYRRWLWGFRPYFTTTTGARLGLSFLKVKDDLGSISQSGASPQDNLVAGFDASVPLFQRKLQWSFSAALSLTALDIRGGATSQEALEQSDIDIPFDPQPLEPLIVINESLTPPNPLGLSSLAWASALNLNHFGQMLSLSYRHFGPAYYSLGNPYLQNDVAGWNVSDQFSLWKQRLFINIGLSRQRDNLRETKPTTTTTTGGWVTLALYAPAPAPQIVITVNNSHGANDLSEIDTLLAAANQDTLFSDLRRSENSLALSASLTESFYLFNLRHILTLSSNQSQFQDQISDRLPGYFQANSSSHNYGLVERTEIGRDLSATWDYSYYSSQVVGTNYRYYQTGVSLSSRLLKREMTLSCGGHRRVGEGDLDRWQADFSAEWEFYPQHFLRGTATHYFNDNIQDEGIYRLYYYKRF